MATLTQTSLLKGVVLGALLIASANSGVSAGKAGTMQVVGNSGVSAQMMFLGTEQKVYILDKTENNPVSVNGHPAWAVEYDINSNSYRPMEVRSNTFCAGGMTLGDGSWLVTGGNKAVTTNGATAKAGAGYGAYNGGKALRFLSPCDNMQCQWNDQNSNQLNMERWYPTVEPLADGSISSLEACATVALFQARALMFLLTSSTLLRVAELVLICQSCNVLYPSHSTRSRISCRPVRCLSKPEGRRSFGITTSRASAQVLLVSILPLVARLCFL